MSRWTPNYTIEEVEGLIDMYEEVEAIRHQLWVLVRYADLALSLRRMPPKEYQATLLVGLLGLDIRWAGKELGVSHDTVWRRYRRGLEWLVNDMNGVTT